MRIWLKEIRVKRGLMHHEVAERAGISRTYYTQIENESGCPSLSPVTAQRIANVLGFNWTRFFEDEGQKPNSG